MRLINVNTLKLEEFVDVIPEYIILSHTWGKDEVSFQKYQIGERNAKISRFCEQARKENFSYAWIDTCCIDKTSSSELSEAINSMYRWYQSSAVCYVYLEDFSNLRPDGRWCDSTESESTIRNLEKCRWFFRGWTLQELISPPVVEFYDRDWVISGTRVGLQEILSKITRVPIPVLTRIKKPRDYPVAARMSWAAQRETTRVEDEAYCLQGLFDVYMPLLYGEGRRAFQRLQEEILKQEEDYTIFAWPLRYGTGPRSPVLASSPSAFDERLISPLKFEEFSNIDFDLGRINSALNASKPPTVSSRGVALDLPFVTESMPRTHYITSYSSAEGSNVIFAAICQTGASKRYFCIALHRVDKQLLRRNLAPWSRSAGSSLPGQLVSPTIRETWMTVGDLRNFERGIIEVGVRKEEWYDYRLKDEFVLDIRTSAATERVMKLLPSKTTQLILGDATYDLQQNRPHPHPVEVAGIFLGRSSDESAEPTGSAVTVGLLAGMPWCSLYESYFLDDVVTRANDYFHDAESEMGLDVCKMVVDDKAFKVELIASVRRSGSILWPPIESIDLSNDDYRWHKQWSYPCMILEVSIEVH